ncbi:DUF6882 domain-containing protein [Streptosporangium carneum]|uniref:DUF6882 domain-containing protein n=1 Tax=Streptosporangium carneum TaxID=47481 RepID=UPI0022F3378B|nr:DUF6882 domain-containing protein [Streptosporangium carneum]
MPETLTLTNLLDDAAMISIEHQLHLADVVGDHNWNVDLRQQRFTFDKEDHSITCSRFHLLGSAAPGPGSWLWAWANPSGFPDELTALSATLRDFGQRYNIAELASAEVPFDTLPGSPAEPHHAASILIEAAKAVTGQWTSYSGDAGGGTRVAFLVEHPAFRLPPPEPARVMRVIQQALTDMWLTDHRRALHGYAVRRGLGATFNADHTKLALTGPGFEATAAFDELGRVADINATLSSTHGA